jgi:lipid II:glycine glycyltransferase (peptidoglycan interpeptide bridge formation enzyme)
VKAKYGWIPYYVIWNESEFKILENPETFLAGHTSVAAALILKRTVSFRGLVKASVLYAPKGPLLDWTNESLRTRVLNDLQSFAKQQKAIFLKIDPDVELGRGVPASEGDVLDDNGQAVMAALKRRGWGFSSDQIQFRNSVLIDLSATEEEMLARMKPKTRYNTRLAEKKGVSLRIGTLDDLPALYKMYAETSVRDGFVIRDEGYYMTVWKLFMDSAQPTASPLIAEVDGEAVAAIFLFMFGKRAYYVYGMSRNAHREKMPTYLLQWEAMKIAKSKGCDVYDLWGAP